MAKVVVANVVVSKVLVDVVVAVSVIEDIDICFVGNTEKIPATMATMMPAVMIIVTIRVMQLLVCFRFWLCIRW